MASVTVALIGGGGKMGTRIANNLAVHSTYRLVCSEKPDAGIARLRERGLEVAAGLETVRCGVPREAARAFMLGHAQAPLAVGLGAISSPFSDAAKVAIGWGTARVIQPGWCSVFEPEQVRAVIHKMLHPEES